MKDLFVFGRFFNIGHNGWYMLSGRISKSVPVRRTRNCDARIRSWCTTKPPLQYVLCACCTTHHCLLTNLTIYS